MKDRMDTMKFLYDPEFVLKTYIEEERRLAYEEGFRQGLEKVRRLKKLCRVAMEKNIDEAIIAGAAGMDVEQFRRWLETE